MSDGAMAGRLRVATWLVVEQRDEVYDGSAPQPNPLNEETSIAVPIVSVDYRITPKRGVAVSTALPLIARTGVVPQPGFNLQADVKVPVYRHLANRQLDSRAILQVGVSRSLTRRQVR
jgi:hypothetical protein